MYCVKCGVELADSEQKCPLCHTPIYYPGYAPKEEARPYPRFEKPETVNPRGIYFIISFAFIIAAVISFVCDLNLGNGIAWSGYVIGGLALFYVLFILPGWFKKYNPAIFIPVDFAAIGLFLAYVNLATGGKWFFTFALPVTGIVTVIISSITILSYYLRRGYLYIFGGAIVGAGAFCPLIEILAVITFGTRPFSWSIYPLIALFLIGMMLIIIGIVKPFRESLCRIFAI
jgi:hypothetical protein